ncbi:glycosyl transferase [Pseudorhizobium endolithicum]|uniref:Glycosyl transferase n=1 Tax=Pseudorhizobium endolithicum TaxID=1191678 RepID=A0ABN7JLL6_9HYPH|nr:glycosyltransferase [Pseudorhizobium endolithicum]CAD7035480.1 glycosyl transferase [Pseudorhizobium endolithicum]
MKILHIITGLGDGGAEAVLYRLCTHDDPSRHHVISMIDGGKYGPLLQGAGVRVTCLGMSRGWISLRGLWQLHRLIRQHKPDAMQTWMYHGDLVGGVVGRLAGCTNVFWNIRHTDLVPGATGRSTRLVARIGALLSPFVPTGIVACAERARTVHIEMGYDCRKLTVIHNGYDVTRFQPDMQARATLRQEFGVSPDTILIGLVGRWNAQKDHPNLLSAFSRLACERKNIALLLIGAGCTLENAELAAQVERHGLSSRVIFAGRRSDIPAVMNALDIHVLSSSSEAFPNVVAEAMACGTPCVVTDVGDAAFIVGETGWVVPPADPICLARALDQALEERQDQETWQARRFAARRRIVEIFSLERMIEAYHQLWKSSASPKEGSAGE